MLEQKTNKDLPWPVRMMFYLMSARNLLNESELDSATDKLQHGRSICQRSILQLWFGLNLRSESTSEIDVDSSVRVVINHSVCAKWRYGPTISFLLQEYFCVV